jgi:hypothetical protein
LPYFVLIGYQVKYQELFDDAQAPAGWTIGNAPGDMAIRGEWEHGAPVPSFEDNNDSSTIVQTYYDFNGGGSCLFTGNASSANSAIGQEDVDGGRTSVISPSIDISSYTKPVLGYSRWFSNSQGTNPRKDWWTTFMSFNNGSLWYPVERTFEPDVSWRRFVAEFPTTLGSNVMFKFVATDSAQPGMSGSIVEAALDAFEIYDLGETPVKVTDYAKLDFQLYPNPTKESVNIVLPQTGETSYEILNSVGQVYLNKQINADQRRINVSTTSLNPGIYYVRVYQQGQMSVKKLTIVK